MPAPPKTQLALLGAALALVAAFLVAYSQTRAFAWDEGFHILAAWSVLHGKRPYIDFCFSQAPLNAYLSAALMGVFGENWRVPHAAAAICSSLAAILTCGFVWRMFDDRGPWRFPAAVMAMVFTGLNVLVIRYGGIAQPYGECILALVAGYLASIKSIHSNAILLPAVAGLCCGWAADSSLLTAPAGIVLLLWILAYNRAGVRLAKAAAFVFGEALAFAQFIWLFAQGPRQTVFGLIDYNLRYRMLDWPTANTQNFEVLISWIDCGPAVFLVLLAAAGLLFVVYQSGWEPRRKAEFYLCAWLAFAFGLYITYVRPTFPRYYIFAVPFLAILAVEGLRCVASRLHRPDRPWPAVFLLTFLVFLGLVKTFYDERDDMTWFDMERVARKVAEVTPAGQPLFADEKVYFLLRRTPPSGMEMRNSHKFEFPPATSALFHVIPEPELDRRIQAGDFATLETCEDDDFVQEHHYPAPFAKSAEVGDCWVYWDRKPAAK